MSRRSTNNFSLISQTIAKYIKSIASAEENKICIFEAKSYRERTRFFKKYDLSIQRIWSEKTNQATDLLALLKKLHNILHFQSIGLAYKQYPENIETNKPNIITAINMLLASLRHLLPYSARRSSKDCFSLQIEMSCLYTKTKYQLLRQAKHPVNDTQIHIKKLFAKDTMTSCTVDNTLFSIFLCCNALISATSSTPIEELRQFLSLSLLQKTLEKSLIHMEKTPLKSADIKQQNQFSRYHSHILLMRGLLSKRGSEMLKKNSQLLSYLE